MKWDSLALYSQNGLLSITECICKRAVSAGSKFHLGPDKTVNSKSFTKLDVRVSWQSWYSPHTRFNQILGYICCIIKLMILIDSVSIAFDNKITVIIIDSRAIYNAVNLI